MFNANGGSRETYNESLDSKYTVADILSSMANGDPLSPTYTEAQRGYSNTYTPSATTPLLTPTTIASLERTFIELHNNPITTPGRDLSRESGFVPPIVEPLNTNPGALGPGMPVKQEYMDYSYMDEGQEDEEWLPSSSKRARSTTSSYESNIPKTVYTAGAMSTPGRRPTGPRRNIRNDGQTVEEDQKRSVRRERNKQAAAKCRQRRVDLTNKLVCEVEVLEDEKAELENDIQTMHKQKEQLEFLLQAHKPLCNVKKLVQNNNAQLDRSLIKTEKSDSGPMRAPMTNTDSGPMRAPMTNTPIAVSSTAMAAPSGNNYSSMRPSSLAIPVSSGMPPRMSTAVTEALGVPITTPSQGMFSFCGLESMVDGHTGLTPITGVPSCASQIQRSSSDSSPSECLSSPTLMAL